MNRVVLLILMSLWALPAWAGDPRLHWRTLTTDHFYIHFHQREEEVSREVARIAERVHRTLAPLLEHEPSRRTHIVLSDEIDSANGSATVLPYNQIHLFVSHPEGESVLNDYDDWMTVLVTHEYAHILHLDNVSGIPSLINAVMGLGIGKIYSPNQLQPRWFIEGLATFEESARTTAGRTRSRTFDMFLRAAVLENEFQTLAQVSSGTWAFPHGSTAYLYGSYFLKYIADRFGEAALAKISRLYGGRLIPYGINRVVSEVTGSDYDTLWRDFYRSLRTRYLVQRQEIDARGRTPERRLTFHSENTQSPRPWPGSIHDVLYVRDDGYDRVAFMLVDAAGKAPPRLLYKMSVGGKGSPTPDGKAIVTSEVDVCESNYYYHDLFWTEVASGKRRRLTSCARALDPEVSPDGKWVAYTINEHGGRGSKLAVLALDGKSAPKVLTKDPKAGRAYSPAWSPDGRTLAFSEWTRGGYRDIVVQDFATGARRRIAYDRAFDVTPRFSPDGRYLLFASDRTGVYNIFANELATGKLWQVTNILGGAFQPVVSPDGRMLVYQGFTPQGYDLFSTPYDPQSWKQALPFVSERPDAALDDAAWDGSVVKSESDYSPWSTLGPWKISQLRTEPGAFGQLLELDLSGQDTVGIHGWNFHLEQGLGERAETNFSLSYGWNRLWAPLYGSVSHYTTRQAGFKIDQIPQEYAESSWTGNVGASFPIVQHPDYGVTLSTNYHYSDFGPADPLRIPLDPNQAIPEIPESGTVAGVSAGFNFQNVRRFAFSVSPEEGRSLGLGLTLNHDAFGGDFSTLEAVWGWAEFFRMPLRRHVLVLDYDGGIGEGEFERRAFFALGGFGQNVATSAMVLCALRVLVESCPGGTPSLRGYPPGSFFGDKFHALTVEYRFPIAELERGYSTIPFFANRFLGAIYADYGLAYFGETDFSDFRLGVGGELGLNVTLGYAQPASVRLGYARGIMNKGENQIYFQLQLGQLY